MIDHWHVPRMESPPKRRRITRSPSPQYKLDDEDPDSYEPYVPVAQRRQDKLAKLTLRNIDKERQRESEQAADAAREEQRRRERERRQKTLLVEAQAVHSQKEAENAKKTVQEKAEEADQEILEAIKSRRKLASDLELAKGIQYTESLKTR